ncbi:MAG: Nif3-like dinuclear metal center hexameric protein, partial [Kiritimatiellae bacterium]|nr:Nif3-like dinuclear metal center hexameric protein [Kiritimatiellia bacterium]
HHGVSWGGGIRRLTDGEYAVVKAAMDADLALAAYHLPLDANRRYGNNWELARALSLKNVKPAFSYHGNVIGAVGRAGAEGVVVPNTDFALRKGALVGVCSGGAGCFAADARRLGCEVFVTGEASWGEVVAAENIGMTMVCAGHYETETYGVRALARALAAALGVKTQFLPRRADTRAT